MNLEMVLDSVKLCITGVCLRFRSLLASQFIKYQNYFFVRILFHDEGPQETTLIKVDTKFCGI